MNAPDVIVRYFKAQSARDFDTLVGLFAKDGVVIDEGKRWSGASGIREWRENAASVYQYTTELLAVSPEDENEYVAKARLEGNFPGGRVELDYRFTLDGDRIRRLEID
jgi:ketosteroid isomerase-like protein